MRSYDEFEELVSCSGDIIFSAVLSYAGSRERAVEIISSAAARYLERRGKLKTENERYRLLAQCCEKILGRSLPVNPEICFLTEDERGKILSAARLYIKSGGRRKKRLRLIAAVAVLLIILAAVVVYELRFVQSDEFQSGWSSWYKKEEAFRAAYGWAH